MTHVDWFTNRIGILATKHQKEKVMAPLLHEALGIHIQVAEGLDTDQWGTFTREMPRPGDQLQTARIKVETVLDQTGETLALASEGSFGPHPALPYLPCNRELVILRDRLHDLEIVGEDLSTETNYSHATVQSLDEALRFAHQARFPSHALIVMPAADGSPPTRILKGITMEADLIAAIEQVLATASHAHVETDMRAMYNPTRMQAIARATQNLIQKVRSQCPQCGTPGFAVVEHRRGLPCALCQLPTSLTRSQVYQCLRCGFQHESLFPQGVTQADPMHCTYCNP